MRVEQTPISYLPLAPIFSKFSEFKERMVGLVPLDDYLHCQGKGLNTETTASIKRCTTPQDLFHHAFEPLIGEVRPSEALHPLDKLSQWGPRVRVCGGDVGKR